MKIDELIWYLLDIRQKRQSENKPIDIEVFHSDDITNHKAEIKEVVEDGDTVVLQTQVLGI